MTARCDPRERNAVVTSKRPARSLCRFAVAIGCTAGGVLAAVLFSGAPRGVAGEARHGIAMHGLPALPPDFTRLAYADPGAPKGGRLVHGVLGTFDSLNPLIVKGLAVPAMRGLVIDAVAPITIRSCSYCSSRTGRGPAPAGSWILHSAWKCSEVGLGS